VERKFNGDSVSRCLARQAADHGNDKIIHALAISDFKATVYDVRPRYVLYGGFALSAIKFVLWTYPATDCGRHFFEVTSSWEQTVFLPASDVIVLTNIFAGSDQHLPRAVTAADC